MTDERDTMREALMGGRSIRDALTEHHAKAEAPPWLATRCAPGGNPVPLTEGEIDLLDPDHVRRALDTLDREDRTRLLRGIAQDAQGRLNLIAGDPQPGAVSIVKTMLAGLNRSELTLVWSYARGFEEAAKDLARLAHEAEDGLDQPEAAP